LLLGHATELVGEAGGVVVEEDVGAQEPGSFARRGVDLFVDLLDQTGQGAAHLADEDENGQVMLTSDRTSALAGEGAGHELRDEPAAIISFPDLGTGSQVARGERASGE